ncbi:conserved Plasmodium protein, unknown function [Plasmodium sp. gorilla clade G2]|uniref:conserved Plasmodium protein, unknown function n=1 Tax=Plasmodium sp. gorilla clade G2 TaxID=880535 RepID=UPI000D21D652|nr:conserved Plasmodium protein, unknown function [Plasmodium sp. gorilla clade G2]SOV14641.1 conserved Plasmodium protein, unknown function [Plasmodium sp. gorilla clade G2]
MKVENKIIKEDPFSVSHVIGDRLLQGWTLLNATCHICNITPLIKQKNKEDRYCARCDLFIKIKEETSHTNEEKINDKLNGEIIEDKKKDNDVDDDNQNLFNGHDKESNFNNDPLMYIKEIKLQNEEFNNILNKNNICTKDLVGDLLEYKNYIKDRCGYNVAQWLNMETINEKRKDEDYITNEKRKDEDYITNEKRKDEDYITNEKRKDEDILNEKRKDDDYITNEQKNTYNHTNSYDEEYIYNIHRKYFKNIYQNNVDEKIEDNPINVLHNVRRDLKISEENYFCPSKLHSNKYNKLETEFFILNKTKNILMDKLEKFTDKLYRNDNKNEELENINHIVTIVTILEKINNLKKYVMV